MAMMSNLSINPLHFSKMVFPCLLSSLFDAFIREGNPYISDVALDTARDNMFAKWFKKHVSVTQIIFL